jgi:uncharacterized protein
LDPDQGYRERENTTVDDIVTWSQELGAGKPELISLEGSQFRCGGSAEYVTWVESVLKGQPVSENQVHATAWRNPPPPDHPLNVIHFPKEDDVQKPARAAEEAPPYKIRKRVNVWGFDFQIFHTPTQLEDALRARAREGNSIRLLSSYSRKWKTRKATAAHDLPASMQDFCEAYMENGEPHLWSRVWNFVPQSGTDYTAFIRAAPGTRMATDPLCEVGCPYAVRGFDYDYVGVLWLDDLVWRSSHWEVRTASVHESGIMNVVRRARDERATDGSAHRELLERVAQAYRILLTRPLRGAYLWIPDDDTRSYIEASLDAQ